MKEENAETRATCCCVRSFTLIEMLVVISIIAVLAALLMPALQKAVDASKTVSCSNNMKNLSVIYHSFADDNLSYMPICYYNPNTGGSTELFCNLDNASGTPVGWSYEKAANRLLSYLNQTGRMLTCPSDKRTYLPDADSTHPRSSYMVPSDYFSRHYVSGGTQYSAKRKITNVKHPGRLFMTLESGDDAIQTLRNRRLSQTRGAYDQFYGSFGYHHNDNNGFNGLFFDGHVEFSNFDIDWSTIATSRWPNYGDVSPENFDDML